MNVALAAFLATSMKLVAAHAYPEGAPPGFSGGFGEESCHACHFHQDLNASPGRVAVDGLPAQYEAGKRYTLTITVSRSGMKSAGFQLSARFKDGGAQAGTLAAGPADAGRVTISREGTVQYAGQNKTGSVLTDPGMARWSVEWTAPSSGGAVTVNVAANAADDNGSADGDFIYTSNVVVAPAGVSAAGEPPGT